MSVVSRSPVLVLLTLATLLGPRARAQQGTPSPHGSAVGAQDCLKCHRSDTWRPARIPADYKHTSLFPLYGAHAAASCRSCHIRLDFGATPARCASCHRDPHMGELGADCARCHTVRSFIDRSAMVRAHQLTRFPLVGAHRNTDCESCHFARGQGQPRYATRSTDCVSCHELQLHAAKNPDHVAAGFSRNCGTCHTPTYWNRASYDHSATAFPLTGGHRGAPCSACHADGVYKGKSTTCESCHLADYQATTDPSHTAAQFPTTCVSCHNTVRWSDATFNHDGPYFPIYSGAHRGKWPSCSTCHTNAADFRVFSCLSCHLATETNGHHQGISGYRYDSQACYSCHRDGRKP